MPSKQVQCLSTQSIAPHHSIAAVAIMSKPERIFYLRHMACDHLAVSTEAVARENQGMKTDGFLAFGAVDCDTPDDTTVAVITAAISSITKGKGKITKIEKL